VVSNRIMRGIAKACLASILGVWPVIPCAVSWAQSTETMQSLPKSPPAYGVDVYILTSQKDVDFLPLMRQILKGVERPGDTGTTDRGKVVVRFAVNRDGSVFNDAIAIETSSNNAAIDRSAVDAVRRAAPFKGVPKRFKGTVVDVRISFEHNVGDNSPSVIP
jgi:TonB family protein